MSASRTLTSTLVPFVAAFGIASAVAADLYVKAPPAPPPAPASVWDIAFGASIMTDYNFRGISQSDRGPAVGAYFEPRFDVNPNLQLYVGLGGVSVKLPTDPTAEINIYGGFRATAGAFSADIGALYYYYPKESMLLIDGSDDSADTDFVEVYGKFGYAFNDRFAIGVNIFYAPDVLNTGGDGTYVAGTAKFTAPGGFFGKPDLGAYASGEVGHYFFEDTTGLIDYTTWNVGFGFTYKALTLDLRYHDTDLSREECQSLTGDPWAARSYRDSKWCSAAFIAKLAVDSTLNALR